LPTTVDTSKSLIPKKKRRIVILVSSSSFLSSSRKIWSVICTDVVSEETRMSLNKILLIGNLGSDPEIRNMPSGKKTAQFPLATNRKYKMEGQIREETEWFQVVAFGRLAEICGEFLKKGKPVFIEGRVHTSNWVDSAGQKHYRTQIVAEGMRMIGTFNGTGQHTTDASESNPEPF